MNDRIWAFAVPLGMVLLCLNIYGSYERVKSNRELGGKVDTLRMAVEKFSKDDSR